MHVSETLRMAVYAGKIMLANGAETYRVEDTVSRILSYYHMARIDVLVTPTGIFASSEDASGQSATLVSRVERRSINLTKVALVNNISRGISSGGLSTPQALQKLQEIDGLPAYSNTVRVLACGMACFCFTVMVGGSIPAGVLSLVCGAVMYPAVLRMDKTNLAGVSATIAASMIIPIVALPLVNLFKLSASDLDKVIVGGIIPLLPGIGLTNAIRDVMGGDYLSGVSRILDAVLVGVAIAAGVGFVYSGWVYLFGGLIL